MLTRRDFIKATAVTAAGLSIIDRGTAAHARTLRAFPGAQGYGTRTPGGRGGRVVEVTNLNDGGTGSLRAAVETSGRRTVVFTTGGTIALDSPLVISDPFLTIAGQTAPGDGICIMNGRNDRGCVLLSAHDVIMRHVRIRPGVGGATFPNDTVRAITITDDGSNVPYNVVVDHCSLSWGIDTCATIGGRAHDVTIQWCIISEGLNDSVHAEGPHSRGLMSRDRSERVSIHHNLLAHNDYRNPEVSNHGVTDVVNNVIYDYEHKAISSTDVEGVHERFNWVGNYIKRGPSSTDEYHELNLHPMTGAGWTVYADGNIGPFRSRNSEPDEDSFGPLDREYVVSEPAFRAPHVTTTSAKRALSRVLAKAGATRPSRDAVDRRIVDDVRDGTGSLIDDPRDVGGYPDLARGTPPRDSDHDGIPDAWERAHGLNPHTPTDARRTAPNGYTWLENYLSHLAG
jgi:pectate lyase